MGFASAANSIRGRFQDLIAVTHVPANRIQYDNQGPDAGFNKPGPDALWCRVSVREGARTQVGIGTPGLYRTQGIIIIGIFTPLGDGDGRARELADTIDGAFRDAHFNGVLCRPSSVTTLGRSEGWWQVNVTVPFQYDEYL